MPRLYLVMGLLLGLLVPSTASVANARLITPHAAATLMTSQAARMMTSQAARVMAPNAAAGGAVLSAVPSSAPAGAPVTLIGAGYHAATDTYTPTGTIAFTPSVTIVFTDAAGTVTTLPQAATSTSGSFNVGVVLPGNAAAGPAVFSATDISGSVALAAFDVRPVASVAHSAPNYGVPNASITLTGSGFAANEALTVTLVQGAAAIVTTVLAAGTITSTSTGQFSAVVTIPGAAPAGGASIVVQDGDGNNASTPFAVIRNGAPTVALTPATGGAAFTAAGTVTLTGTNFAAAEPITLTFGQGVLASVLVSGSITTDAAGAFVATATIPSTAISGTAAISATDRDGNRSTTALSILGRAAPSLAIGPTTVAPSAPVTLTGTNFAAGQPVTLTFGQGQTTAVLISGTVTADGTGAFTTTATIPSVAISGTATISATDGAGDRAAVGLSVARLAPSVVVSPTSVAPTAPVTLTGVNFTAGQPITLTFGQGITASVLVSGSVTADATGAFTATTTIPSAAISGTAAISATDGAGDRAAAALSVVRLAPSVVVSPTDVTRASPVTLSGANFAAHEPVTVTFRQGMTDIALVTGTVTTDSAGVFTATVRLPSSAITGTATISATDRDRESAATVLDIMSAAGPAVIVAPASVEAGASVTITGTDFAVARPITLTFAGRASSSETVTTTLASKMGTVVTDDMGTFTATVAIPSAAITGTATIEAMDGAGNTARIKVRIVPPVRTDNGPTTLYFAEGYTGLLKSNNAASFDETLAILNANPFTATVHIRYLIQGGKPMEVTRTLAPNRMLRESVKRDVGPDQTVAAVVTSPSRVSAERIISRVGYSGATLGASSSLGNPNLGSTFYFPAGATGSSYTEYLSLVNPGDKDATVIVTYAGDGGKTVDTTPEDEAASDEPPAGQSESDETPSLNGTVTVTLTVPANGRTTHRVGNDSGDSFASSTDTPVGMIVTSDQPIMAERTLYFGDGLGSGKFGSTAQAGIMTAGNQYMFAYGSAGGNGLAQRTDDQSEIVVLNPGVSPMSSTVEAQFTDDLGRTLGVTSVVVGPGARQTVDANAVVRDTSRIYSTLLTSSSPFVAEKAQYLGGPAAAGAYPGFTVAGAPAGATSTVFPDLSLISGSGAQLQQTVFLHNPTSSPITVTGTYYTDHGSISMDYDVAAGGITTVDVNKDAAGLRARSLSGAFVVSSEGPKDSFVATNVANTLDGRSYTGTQGSLPAL